MECKVDLDESGEFPRDKDGHQIVTGDINATLGLDPWAYEPKEGDLVWARVGDTVSKRPFYVDQYWIAAHKIHFWEGCRYALAVVEPCPPAQ